MATTENSPTVNVPQTLENIVRERGWSWTELAKNLGVTKGAVSSYRSGRRNPEADVLRSIVAIAPSASVAANKVYAAVNGIVALPIDENRKYYILRVMDKMLEPGLRQGDYVVVSAGSYAVGDIVLVLIDGSYKLTRSVNIMEDNNILGRVAHILARAI